MSWCRHVVLVIFGVQLSQNLLTSGLTIAQKQNGEVFVNDNGHNLYSMDILLNFENALRPKREVQSESEINQRLQNIESDLKTLKTYGPIFIYFLSDNKKFYKLVLMIMMYLFLFTFYHRKIRRRDETVNANTNSKTEEVTSADVAVIDIPNSSVKNSN